MKTVNAIRDTCKIYVIVNYLNKKGKQPPSNLTSDKDDKLLRAPKDVAAVWFNFLHKKFSTTKAEDQRDSLEMLPTERTDTGSLTRAEFVRGIKWYTARRSARHKVFRPRPTSIDSTAC